MSRVTQRVTPSVSRGTKIPPLENGDNLTVEEFKRRWDATPGLKKAELIEGVVYMAWPGSSPTTKGVPPLENGDHLTIEEFKRRFDAMPGLKKAELIEGMVYMSPPVSVGHSQPHWGMIALLTAYQTSSPGVRGGIDGSICLDLETMPQPDAMLLIEPARGGQTTINAEGYVQGAPELVVEIAASTVSYDLNQKLEAYRQNGVCEYIVWRTRDREIDYFVLKKGKYNRLSPGKDGVFRSGKFPGLWIDAGALLKDDVPAALKTLQQGIGSPEHETFVAALRQRAGANPANPL
jgi:Uma2 family endonuclease